MAFGERLTDLLRQKRDARGNPWSNSELARRLQARRGLESPPTRSVGLYRNGDRLPAAAELRDLADVLDVPVDWLLCGEGPATRAQLRDGASLESTLAEYLRREIVARVGLERRERWTPADVMVDGGAVLAAFVDELTAQVAAQATAVQRGLETVTLYMQMFDVRTAQEEAWFTVHHGAQSASLAVWVHTRPERAAAEYRRLLAAYVDPSSTQSGESAGMTDEGILRMAKQVQAKGDNDNARASAARSGNAPQTAPLLTGLQPLGVRTRRADPT